MKYYLKIYNSDILESEINQEVTDSKTNTNGRRKAVKDDYDSCEAGDVLLVYHQSRIVGIGKITRTDNENIYYQITKKVDYTFNDDDWVINGARLGNYFRGTSLKRIYQTDSLYNSLKHDIEGFVGVIPPDQTVRLHR